MGKPSKHMAAELLRRLAVDAADAVIVGDRISTDVAMSAPLGMSSVLVLSGATSAAEIERSSLQPDFVIGGLADLLPAAARRGLPEGSSR
jgi:ribonucleotide monophosphatase NagD (HAD superfamily)